MLQQLSVLYRWHIAQQEFVASLHSRVGAGIASRIRAGRARHSGSTSGRVIDLSLLHVVLICTGSFPAPSLASQVFFLEVNRTERNADRSSLSIFKIKNEWNYESTYL
jgi:hypothetical protein